MKQIYVIVLVLLASITQIKAQSDSDLSGDELIAGGNYFAAVKAFEQDVKAEPQEASLWLKLGYCYLELPGEYENAIKKLEKAVELSATGKDKFTNLDSRYTLARAYHAAYRFDDAIRTFNELVAEADVVKFKAIEEIEYELQISKNAKELIDTKVKIRIERAPGQINSESTDHSPFLVGDVLYFTSKRKPKTNAVKDYDGQYNEKIYYTNVNSPDAVEQAPSPISTDGSDAVCWVSDDESLLMYYHHESIWLSERTDGVYSEPKVFKATKSNYREPDAAMSLDGNTVIFASERPGGLGGIDLYQITKVGEEWSKPINLGGNINTPYDDNSPFLHDDGTLYFASKGHNTMGEYDIFYAAPEGSGFAKAVNLGFPTNSVSNDLHYFLSKDKSKAYYTSYRAGCTGYSDIFLINYADSSAKYLVVEADINTAGASPENVDLKIINITDKKSGFEGNLNAASKMELGVERGKEYYAEVKTPGYFPEAFTFTAPTDTTRKRELHSRNLTPVKYENVTKNYKIKFDKKSEDLTENTKLFLNTVTDFHKENPDFVIDITVASEGKDKTNKQRSETVVNYLKEKGVPKEKISVNLINYPGSEGDALLTIMDEGTREKAYIADIDETGTETTTKTTDSTKTVPDPGMKLTKGEYVIQVLASKREISKSDKFFKNCACDVTIVKGKDGINRYMFGNYKYQADAEENLKIIKRKGYLDAFIRPSDWYTEH